MPSASTPRSCSTTSTRSTSSSAPFALRGDSGGYTCDALIIATGASAKYLGLPSEQAFMGRGVSGCATCDGFFYRGQEVCVVGGGNTAVEEALYLSNIAIEGAPHPPPRQVPRRGDPGRQADGQGRRPARCELHLWSTLDEVLGDDQRRERRAHPQHARTTRPRSSPSPAASSPSATSRTPTSSRASSRCSDGYILTKSGLDGFATMTSVPGVFAAGDVQDHVYRQAVTSAGTGCMAALDAQRFLEQAG